MKFLLFALLLFYFSACTRQDEKKIHAKLTLRDTVFKHDTIYINNDDNWQEGFGLTHDPDIDFIWGKPVRFYIDNKNCSPIAIDFYRGQFRPTDNNTTTALLSLVTTNNTNLRPFYRWCLYKTIQIEDGALAESTGFPARQYVEKFPKEFFAYVDADTSKARYNDWVGSISYSGFYDIDDYKKPADIRYRMIKKMKSNCRNCNEDINRRINKLALDCFPQP